MNIEEIKRQAELAAEWFKGDIDYTHANVRYISKALIAASELLQQQQWQPMDSAPKDGTRLLLATRSFGIDVGSWKKDYNSSKGDKADWYNEWGDDFSTGSYYCPLSPTRWQPLPQPPKDRK